MVFVTFETGRNVSISLAEVSLRVFVESGSCSGAVSSFVSVSAPFLTALFVVIDACDMNANISGGGIVDPLPLGLTSLTAAALMSVGLTLFPTKGASPWVNTAITITDTAVYAVNSADVAPDVTYLAMFSVVALMNVASSLAGGNIKISNCTSVCFDGGEFRNFPDARAMTTTKSLSTITAAINFLAVVSGFRSALPTIVQIAIPAYRASPTTVDACALAVERTTIARLAPIRVSIDAVTVVALPTVLSRSNFTIRGSPESSDVFRARNRTSVSSDYCCAVFALSLVMTRSSIVVANVTGLSILSTAGGIIGIDAASSLLFLNCTVVAPMALVAEAPVYLSPITLSVPGSISSASSSYIAVGGALPPIQISHCSFTGFSTLLYNSSTLVRGHNEASL